ncbi:MAG: amino acid-binding protein [Nitrospiraceae bacterium]|nr:amino acid-binding protein [Nitrospiraceae bacterium]
MAYKIDRVDIWTGSMMDKPGTLAKKLAPLTEAGAELEFLLARRDVKGRSLVFLAPLKGVKQAAAAKKARVKKSPKIVALRVEGPDKSGLGSAVTMALAGAGINLRGISALAIGKKCVLYVAFDKKEDATLARRVLVKAL